MIVANRYADPAYRGEFKCEDTMPLSLALFVGGLGLSLLLACGAAMAQAPARQKPQVSISFDTNGKQAIVSREQVFSAAAKSKTWVAAAHLSFPGMGHIGEHDQQWPIRVRTGSARPV